MNNDPTSATKEKVAGMLRSCLVSSKEGVRLSDLMKDFKLVTGKPIPFRDMGFHSLEDFVRNIPNHVTVSRNRSGELLCSAVDNKRTSHIARMVSQQKSSGKKPTKKTFQAHFDKREPAPRTPARNVPFQPTRSTHRTQHKSERHHAANLPSPPNERKRVSNYRPHNIAPRFLNKQLRQPLIEHNQDQRQSVEERSIFQAYPVEEPTTYQRKSSEERATFQKQPEPYDLQPLLSALQQSMLTYKEALEKYCAARDIRLTFRTFPGEGGAFYCLIQFGEKKFSSYPDQYPDINLAQEMLAKKVVETLNEENQAVEALSEENDQYPVTESRSIYLHRLEQLVASCWNGVWVSALEESYRNTYKERLPADWIHYTDSAALRLEEITKIGKSKMGTKIVYPGRRKSLRRVPAPPRPNPEEHWDTYVCYFGSTADLAIRFVDEENRFEDMTEKLQARYNGSPEECIEVDVRNTYAAQIDGGWFRVLTETVCGGNAQCYLIDVGDKDNVPIRNLRILDEEFFQLPSQALHAQLSGLEELCDVKELNDFWRPQILDRTFVARVVNRDDINAIYPLNLFDTSTDVDRDVNQELMGQFLANVSPPDLPAMYEVCEAYMCHISDAGAVYIQICNPFFDILLVILESNQRKIDELPECSSLEDNKVYLVKNSDGFYYRAYVTGLMKNMKHQVFFLDFGDTEFVFRDVIKDPIHLPTGGILSGIPQQAIRCKLCHINNAVCDARAQLMEMAPPHDKVLVRVAETEPDAEGLREVELFKREDNTKGLVSINSTVGLQLSKINDGSLQRGDTNNNTKKSAGRGRGTVTEEPSRVSSPESLSSEQALDSSPFTSLTPPPETPICPNPLHAVPSPDLPVTGRNFDIRVTLAANPSNFSVQSYKEIDKLNSLMTQMYEYYSVLDNQKDAAPETIEEGGFYAAMHNDNCWYRIHVKNKMDGEMLSGLFIDYGDFVVTTSSSLLHLHQQFQALPAQAFKAKISGVTPIHGDWTVEDGIEFKQLVQDRDFVSFVKGTSKTEDGTSLLSLQIVDTSDPRIDVYIDQKLVEEGRAARSS